MNFNARLYHMLQVFGHILQSNMNGGLFAKSVCRSSTAPAVYSVAVIQVSTALSRSTKLSDNLLVTKFQLGTDSVN